MLNGRRETDRRQSQSAGRRGEEGEREEDVMIAMIPPEQIADLRQHDLQAEAARVRRGDEWAAARRDRPSMLAVKAPGAVRAPAGRAVAMPLLAFANRRAADQTSPAFTGQG
jgi:hypothetical protein